MSSLGSERYLFDYCSTVYRILPNEHIFFSVVCITVSARMSVSVSLYFPISTYSNYWSTLPLGSTSTTQRGRLGRHPGRREGDVVRYVEHTAMRRCSEHVRELCKEPACEGRRRQVPTKNVRVRGAHRMRGRCTSMGFSSVPDLPVTVVIGLWG
ncbi:hypothetical protein EI94DRAFT_752291 [Lactarius quietus]|nr:hypothetical protein EI94DRAFT_752291 [Lactarius quietus]